jgi:MoaA/NifB/PqqE/SkfB family radical SAM enzyme
VSHDAIKDKLLVSDRILLSTNEWAHILKEAYECGFNSLHIFGGEPFLYPGLSVFCEHATRLGYHILISTNGISFKSGDEQWLADYGISLSFTINDVQLKWEQLPAAKREWLIRLSEKAIPITISTCLTSENFKHYPAFLEDIRKHGFWGFFGIYFSPIGRALEKTNLVVDPLIWIDSIDGLQELFPVKVERGYISKKDLFFNSIDKTCQIASEQMFTIDYQGNFYPCFLMINQKDAIFAQWENQGDFQKAYAEFHTLKARYSTFHGCPAYIKEGCVDFRLKIIGELGDRGKNLCILCPLVSF